MSFFKPDKLFASLSQIRIDTDLLNEEISGIVLDIDNTIRSRESGLLDRGAERFMNQARQAGIGICLLSNNWHANVHDFADALDLPLVAKACKPLPGGFFKAAKTLGVPRKRCVCIGDQLLTDVMGAHGAGMRAYLIAPLSQVDLAHTLFLRKIEVMILGSAAGVTDGSYKAWASQSKEQSGE